MELPKGCSCELCDGLRTILHDRSRTTLESLLAKDRRAHVDGRIQAAELPVTHQTRRSGRPYALVLAKTVELFERERQHRRRDEADLDWLNRNRAALAGRRARSKSPRRLTGHDRIAKGGLLHTRMSSLGQADKDDRTNTCRHEVLAILRPRHQLTARLGYSPIGRCVSPLRVVRRLVGSGVCHLTELPRARVVQVIGGERGKSGCLFGGLIGFASLRFGLVGELERGFVVAGRLRSHCRVGSYRGTVPVL
jgi:hypothetical protein